MDGFTPNFAPHEGLTDLDSRYVDVEAMEWIEARPGMKMKVLYKNNETRQATIMFKAEPGCVLDEHEHTGLEQTIVLEGSLEDEYGACTAGNYVWRPVGSKHTARCPNGAVFITMFHNSAKTVASGRLFPNYDD